jgi:predicted MPP superfamily phosphohydrolase
MAWFVATVAVGAQIPATAAAARLSGHPALTLAGAAALNVPFIAGMRNPWRDWGRRGLWLRLWLYLGLWPFFCWAALCLAFLLLAPVGLLAAALTPLTVDQALAACGAAAVVLGARALSRRPRLVTHDVAVTGLPAALDGYRIAHISDVHCGPLTPPSQVRRWVEAVNRAGADLAVVTGDLITSGDAYVADVAAALGELRARDGVFASMGNHDYFGDGESLVDALERHGVRVLRNRGVLLEAGALYLGGVDDTWTKRADVRRTLAERPAGTAAVLLAHDPNLFPSAAEAGADLVLSGHTHGGQFAVPGFARRWNLARIITSYSSGLYRHGRAALYVNRGLGTTGPPIRLGAPPEIAVLRLRHAA